jgi:tetratricopeptide (TPR) repeat protein
LLRKLAAEVYIYIGRPDKAVEAGMAAATLFQDLGDSIKEAETRLDVSFSFHWIGQETKAIAAIKRALACLEAVPGEVRLLAKAHVQWGLSATISGNIPKALEHLSRAEALHARMGTIDSFIGVVDLWARSWCAFAAGTLRQILDATQ